MADDAGPFSILLRCALCDQPPPAFEAGLNAAGQAQMTTHLKRAHGLTFDPPTLDAWLARVRRA